MTSSESEDEGQKKMTKAQMKKQKNKIGDKLSKKEKQMLQKEDEMKN